METWKEQILKHLANLHPTQITEGVIKPAIDQIIDDYEDSLNYFEEGEEEQIKLHKQLIKFWKDTRRKITKEA